MQLVSHQRLPEEYLRRQVRTAESRPITFTVIERLFRRMGHPGAVFIRRSAGRPAGMRVEYAADPAAERTGFVPPARDKKERDRTGAVRRRTARKRTGTAAGRPGPVRAYPEQDPFLRVCPLGGSGFRTRSELDRPGGGEGGGVVGDGAGKVVFLRQQPVLGAVEMHRMSAPAICPEFWQSCCAGRCCCWISTLI